MLIWRGEFSLVLAIVVAIVVIGRVKDMWLVIRLCKEKDGERHDFGGAYILP